MFKQNAAFNSFKSVNKYVWGEKKHLQDAKDCLGESNIDQFLPFNQI